MNYKERTAISTNNKEGTVCSSFESLTDADLNMNLFAEFCSLDYRYGSLFNPYAVQRATIMIPGSSWKGEDPSILRAMKRYITLIMRTLDLSVTRTAYALSALH